MYPHQSVIMHHNFICFLSGHALDIVDYLSEKHGCKYEGDITTYNQVQHCYEEIAGQFDLKPTFMQACQLYILGVELDKVFQFPSQARIIEAIERCRARERDEEKKHHQSGDTNDKFPLPSIKYEPIGMMTISITLIRLLLHHSMK